MISRREFLGSSITAALLKPPIFSLFGYEYSTYKNLRFLTNWKTYSCLTLYWEPGKRCLCWYNNWKKGRIPFAIGFWGGKFRIQRAKSKKIFYEQS